MQNLLQRLCSSQVAPMLQRFEQFTGRTLVYCNTCCILSIRVHTYRTYICAIISRAYLCTQELYIHCAQMFMLIFSFVIEKLDLGTNISKHVCTDSNPQILSLKNNTFQSKMNKNVPVILCTPCASLPLFLTHGCGVVVVKICVHILGS